MYTAPPTQQVQRGWRQAVELKPALYTCAGQLDSLKPDHYVMVSHSYLATGVLEKLIKHNINFPSLFQTQLLLWATT